MYVSVMYTRCTINCREKRRSARGVFHLSGLLIKVIVCKAPYSVNRTLDLRILTNTLAICNVVCTYKFIISLWKTNQRRRRVGASGQKNETTLVAKKRASDTIID